MKTCILREHTLYTVLNMSLHIQIQGCVCLICRKIYFILRVQLQLFATY